MPIQDFCLKFDKPGATYAPGDTVTGAVCFVLTKPKKFKEIRLKIRGEAETRWSESESDMNNESKTVWYGSKELYFKVPTRIIGTGIRDEQTTLPAGQHSLPFSFQLLDNIPSSFKHKYGKIQYGIKTTLDRPDSINRKIDSPFTVAAPYDFNVKQGFTSTICEQFVHQFHQLVCVSAGTMKINVSSGASKFIPGEKVELIVKHDASSTEVDIIQIKLKLVKKLTFHDKNRKKEDLEVLQRVQKNGPYDKKGETSLGFVFPELPLLNLQHCSIIDLSYEIVLSIKVSGLHRKIQRFYPL